MQSVVIDVEGDATETFARIGIDEVGNLSREQVVENLIASGLWPALRTRPYSKVPAIDSTPHSLFVTAMDSNPLAADPAVLSNFLTDMGDLHAWRGGHSVDGDMRSSEAWGELVIARANKGEVITMDAERYWEGIYTWFRSRGVDYDTPPRL